MSWTYTNDPSTVTLDQLRFLIGDIDSDDPQLTDEVLNWLLTSEGNVYAAAVAAAQSLAALYSRLVDKSVGDLRVSYSQRTSQYEKLIERLRRKVIQRSATPFAGGISEARKETVREDSDRVNPAFERNQFRHPGSDSNPLLSDDGS